jgi:hypothetical protein
VTRVRFVEPARLEVLAEVGYYHRVEAGLGAKFLEALEDAIARALAYPLGHTHWQAHQRKIERAVCFSGIFPSHWSIAQTNRESQSMHWLIMHADQVIGGAEQMTANIKIQKTGAEVASYAEAMSRF